MKPSHDLQSSNIGGYFHNETLIQKRTTNFDWVFDTFFIRVFLSSKTSAQCKCSITSTATLLNEYYSHVTYMSTNFSLQHF